MSAHKSNLPEGRTLEIRADMVKSLRLKEGWTVEQLANQAHCSVKTIQNVEHGHNIYLATLIKIAKALKVDHQALLADTAIPAAVAEGSPQSPNVKTRNIYIILAINSVADFDEATQLPKLVEELRKVASIHENINIKSVVDSSVKITLDMHEDDVLSLVSAFIAGSLQPLGIVELGLPPNQHMLDILRRFGMTRSTGETRIFHPAPLDQMPLGERFFVRNMFRVLRPQTKAEGRINSDGSLTLALRDLAKPESPLIFDDLSKNM